MVYLKLFQTEQERQACTDTQEYVSYTVDTDKVNIHKKQTFCKLTLNNGDIIEIEGSGELTSTMTSQYKTTTVSAEIGELCTSIGDGVFFSCSGLTNITIPNSVTSIGGGAFQHCTSLSSITSLATTAPTIQSSTFENVKTNGTLYVPSGSSGYDTWMQNTNFYLGKYNWTKVEQ